MSRTMQKEKGAPEVLTLTSFLELYGPSTQRRVSDLCTVEYDRGSSYILQTPILHLYCSNDRCNGLRYFRYNKGQTKFSGKVLQTHISYLCSNCGEQEKLFSLQVAMSKAPVDASPFGLEFDANNPSVFPGLIYKYGELPAFGPHTPTRLQKLLGDQLDTFMKGRRCETQGLGIGAFVYYRRVVEHQKTRFLSEIISAATFLNAPAEQIASLESAKAETQFTKALASVKGALPQALLVQGHNPLTLLHSALSAGVHEHSDEECLELAQDIRVVLVDLAERLSQVLKDNAELKGAVSRLLKKKAATSK